MTRTRCAPRVRVMDILLTQKTCDHLWWLRNTQGPIPEPRQTKTEFMARIKQSYRDELAATLRAEDPPSCASIAIVPIERHHCASDDEARALQGQLGGVLGDYDTARQPSLANGRIVCLFAGAMLANDEDQDAYSRLLGPALSEKVLHDYAADVDRRGTRSTVTWAPYGGGNMAQYFNSAFKRDPRGQLVVDAVNTNMEMSVVTLSMSDKHGELVQRTLTAIVQKRPLRPGEQIRLDYGERYRLDLPDAMPPAEATIKQE